VANDARTAFVAEGGGWGAHVQLNEHPAVGMGDSKEEAIADCDEASSASSNT
jgi:hypothetical protein